MVLTVIVTAIVVSGHLLGGQSLSVNNLQLDSENVKRFAPLCGGGGWRGGVVSRRESTNEALDSDLHENAKRVAPFYGGRWGGTVVSRRESRNEARVIGGGLPGGVVSRREAENEELDSDRAENAKRLTYDPFRQSLLRPIS
uniref:Secreted protein n=1 Tax=Biomphalaria glabrata TaxID=6526 RepID=A0A2C9KYY5_BIOGL